MFGGSGSARGSATVGAVAAVSMVITAGVFGNGVASRQLEFGQSGHWVMSALSAVHINGGSRLPDAKTGAFDKVMQGAQVVQGQKRAFAVKGGTYANFGPADLRASAPSTKIQTTEQPLTLQAAGDQGPFLVYRALGRVVRFGTNEIVDVGQPVRSAVVDDDQTLWLETNGSDEVCSLPSRSRTVSCGVKLPAGSRGGLTVLDGKAAFVSATANELVGLAHGEVVSRTKLAGHLSPDAKIAPHTVGGLVASVDGSNVTFTPVGSGSVSTYRLTPGDYTPPVAADDALVLVSKDTNTVITVGSEGGIHKTKLPAAAADVRVTAEEDGRVYVDDGQGKTTVVVDADGSQSTVDVEPGDLPDGHPRSKPDKGHKPATPGIASHPTRPSAPGSGNGRANPAPQRPGVSGPPPVVARAPEPPQPRSSTSGNAKATLTWLPGAINGSPLTGFDITWTASGDGSSSGETQITSPHTLTTVVEGLRNGAVYQFLITESNGVGTSAPTAFDLVTPSADVPDAPAGVTAAAAQDGTVTVSWQPADAQGAGQVTGYNVTASSSSGPVGSAPVAGTSVTMGTSDGLSLGTSYTFTVTTTTDKQVTSDPSAPSGAATPWKPADAPTFTGTTSSNNTVTYSWTQPLLNGGSLQSYEVTFNGGTPTTQTATTYSGPGTNGTGYTLVVRAVTTANGQTASGASASAAASPHGTPIAGGTSASASGDRAIAVSWSVNMNGGSSATCHVFLNNTDSWSGGCGTSGNTTIGGLSYSTTYDVYVRADNDQGAGAPSNHASARTNDAPPPPRTVSVSKGAKYYSSTACTSKACAYIHIAIRNFAANSNFTASCSSDQGADYYTYTITTDGNGSADSEYCFYGYSGHQVWATVGGLESNHIAW